MDEQALAQLQAQFVKIAGHIGHPGKVAAVAFVIAASVFAFAFRAKRPAVGGFAAVGIIMLGLTPFAASSFLQSRGVYHVQVVLLRPDQTVEDIAQVKSSNGGELKMVAGGWELDVPQQARPADGKLRLSAIAKDEFMKGESTIVLGDDYNPTATIQLVAETSAMVRGIVVDEDLAVVAGAKVSVGDYPAVAVTNAKGNFVLPGHAGNGQMVEIHAQKGNLTGHLTAPAGKVVEVVLGRE
ncbi:MAG: carboxypeptidase-like regulatory domain-containing protein [Terriglobales bacterium]